MIASSIILLVVAVSSVTCEKEEVKHVEGVIPLNVDINGQVDAKVHASQVPGANFIGGGLVLQHDNGATGAVDVTHQLSAGTKLDLGAGVPLHKSADDILVANMHGSQVFGDPNNKAQSVGGGLNYNHNSGLNAGVDVTHSRGYGTKLDLGAHVPLYRSDDSHLNANVHGSQVFGAPYKAQSVGGGLQYQHDNGIFSNVDATHHQGIGNRYSANVGRSFDVGPGTLSVGVGAAKNPWSSSVDKQIGVNYKVFGF